MPKAAVNYFASLARILSASVLLIKNTKNDPSWNPEYFCCEIYFVESSIIIIPFAYAYFAS
jgi:hypothetical protein